MTRRGVTLIELLVVLVLLPGLVLLGVAIVGGAGREGRRVVQALVELRTMATLGGLLRYELGDAGASDLSSPDGTSLFFRRRVGDAAVCRASSNELTVAAADWHGVRSPEAARDLVEVVDDDGRWIRAEITGVSGGRCPSGTAGWTLTLDREAGAGRHLRVGEPVRLMAYRSGASDWFGLAPADGSASVQPFAGPLLSGSGEVRLEADGLIVAGRPPGGRSVSILIPLPAVP